MATKHFSDGSVIDTGAAWPGGGGSGSAAIGPDAPPSSPNAMDDEFNAGSLDGKWTWFDQGTTAASFGSTYIHLQSPLESSARLRGIEQTYSAPAKFRAKITGINPNNFNLCGLGLRDSATGRLIVLDAYRVGPTVAVDYWTNNTTYLSSPLGAGTRAQYTINNQSVGWGYFEIEDDGTNIICRFSVVPEIDALFTNLVSVTRAAHVASPNRVGLYVNAQNVTTPGRMYCDWFRRIT